MLRLALGLLIALAPATQPTSRPASQPAAPRADEQTINDATLKFRFAVPKTWKAIPQNASASIYVFQLPAVGDSRRSTPTFIVTGRALDGATLADEVAGRREAILQRNPGITFAEDAANTPAGHEGWSFAYVTKLNQKVSDNRGGNAHVEQIPISVRDQIVVIDGRAVEFVVTGDEKGMAIRRRQLDRVISTLSVE